MRLLAAIALCTLLPLLSFSQEKKEKQKAMPIEKGTVLIEINTGFGEGSPANTSLFFRDGGDGAEYGIGGEGGYFIAKNLALKAGLGFADTETGDDIKGDFMWKFGTKYYIDGRLPLQVDVNGLERFLDSDSPDSDISQTWIGVQGGAAIRFHEHLSLEPGLRFAFPTGDSGGGDPQISLNIGFAALF